MSTATGVGQQGGAHRQEAPVLETRALTKTYSVGRLGGQRLVRALNAVDLTLEKGTVLGLVGESGSGKTTFVRTVAYLERPTSGQIRVLGKVLPARPSQRRLREHRSQAQMIFQDPYTSLDPLHTVRYSISRPLRSFRVVKRGAEDKAVEQLLEQVGLVPASEYLRRYPYQLSGGQRQRVGIARALAAQPALLLADEPTSMLDVSIRLNIMNLLLDLQRSRSLSLVFVTHDLAGASYMSDQIAIMYAGHILELGPATAVMGEPRHPYTQLLRRAAPDPASHFRSAQRFEARGDPPDLADLPQGCPFAPRCPHARQECTLALPEWSDVGQGHKVRCILYK
ncbi:MAG TPA: ABC transporter ATP-binding protein [Acidimicrobiales bacterium]|nr:ABC transporter ATP-binding protein [Acidimicrobiales bacterium]